MKHTFINNKQYDMGSTLMSQVGSGLVGGALGIASSGVGDIMQVAEQGALGQQQLQNNEALSAFNYGQQYKLWQETNAPAQVQQYEMAGLNPALMYSRAGGPGGTTGTPSGGAGMGIAPNQGPAIAQAALQQQETQADIHLKEAQANNIDAKTPQEANLMQTEIDSINQGISNQQAQQVLTEAQTQTQKLQNSLQGATLDDQIAQIQAASSKIQQEAQQAVRNNYIDQKTMEDKIKTIHGIMIGQFVQNNLQQAQTNLTQEQQTQIVNKISQDWKNIDINAQNANTNEGHLKIQQLIKDIPDSKGILYQGLTRLIPNIVVGF